jgi:hypothetical protein
MELEVGEHYWGVYDGKLVVLICTKYGVYAAGPWEGDFKGTEILSKIERPGNADGMDLYYK